MIRVQREDFDVGAEITKLTSSDNTVGGLCVFVGLVRDMAGENPVQAMTLEHYPAMTEKQLQAIEAEAHARWPLHGTAIIHRFGRLEPGDRIVFVAAASAHRDAAFEACRFLIDWLKTQAPFWKREEGPEGERWVEARRADTVAAARWGTPEIPLSSKEMSRPMTSYDAVFFDFDGVLAESADIKTQAFIEMYKEHGSEVVDAVVAHHTLHGGVSRRKKIRYCHKMFLGERLSEEGLEVLARRFSGLVEDAVVAADWVSGAHDVLRETIGRLPMFVVSGTPESELRRITARRGMDAYFVAVRGSPPSKVPIIWALLEDNGLTAERVLFIGDSLTDFKAAQATGLSFIGRVPEGGDNPFPPGTTVITDLTELDIFGDAKPPRRSHATYSSDAVPAPSEG
ncbi:MAG: molybdenum cofactor biosynthesis protein MoaE [Rhodospirillales bacterium]|nr:molybdenum cofactor biosynthesis protein MoaE [Rhodospirillales bacterium]